MLKFNKASVSSILLVLTFVCLFPAWAAATESPTEQTQKEPPSETLTELYQYKSIKIPVEKVWYEESKSNWFGVNLQHNPIQTYTIKKEPRYFTYRPETSSFQPQLFNYYGTPTALGNMSIGGAISFLSIYNGRAGDDPLESIALIQNILYQIPLEATFRWQPALFKFDAVTSFFEGSFILNILLQQSNLTKNQSIQFSRFFKTSAGLQVNLSYLPYLLGLAKSPEEQLRNFHFQVGYQWLLNPWTMEQSTLFYQNAIFAGIAMSYL